MGLYVMAFLGVMPLSASLFGPLAQAIGALAAVLDMPKSQVYQTATFYALFSFAPQGKHVVRLCRSICCYLSGSDALLAHAEKRLGIGDGETTADGLFTLRLAECLAACDRAPAMMIDDKTYGPLTAEDFDRIIGEYR